MVVNVYPLDQYCNCLGHRHVGCAASAVGGMFGIWRIARRSRRVTNGSLLALASELAGQVGIKRRVRLLQGETDMPLTWGIIRPQILIPPTRRTGQRTNSAPCCCMNSHTFSGGIG